MAKGVAFTPTGAAHIKSAVRAVNQGLRTQVAGKRGQVISGGGAKFATLTEALTDGSSATANLYTWDTDTEEFADSGTEITVIDRFLSADTEADSGAFIGVRHVSGTTYMLDLVSCDDISDS